MLVTDLYQDGSKTPSASIQSVLSGETQRKKIIQETVLSGGLCMSLRQRKNRSCRYEE